MTKRIYIAGPMRGIPYFNFRAFDAAQVDLTADGWDVVSPADLDREAGWYVFDLPTDTDWNDPAALGFDTNEAMERDLEALRTCDAIWMLDGWERSKGARCEFAYAQFLGLEVHGAIAEPQASQPEDVLEEALRITQGDRQASYGPPDQDFTRTASLWSVLLGVDVEARQVALCMIALKLSRETHQRKRDNWVDIAGYARCGSLCE